MKVEQIADAHWEVRAAGVVVEMLAKPAGEFLLQAGMTRQRR
jgi:hypothetical protein